MVKTLKKSVLKWEKKKQLHLKNKIRESQAILEDSDKLVIHRKNRDTFEAPKRKRKT